MAYDWYGTGRHSTGPRESDLRPHLPGDDRSFGNGRDPESGHFWPRDHQAVREARDQRTRHDSTGKDGGTRHADGRDKIWPRSFRANRSHQRQPGTSDHSADRALSHGGYRGVGPRHYTRSDDRILDDIYDRLTEDPDLDASDIEVRISSGKVTLEGTVDSRTAKRLAEDDVEYVSGVVHCQNNLRVRGRTRTPGGTVEPAS